MLDRCLIAWKAVAEFRGLNADQMFFLAGHLISPLQYYWRVIDLQFLSLNAMYRNIQASIKLYYLPLMSIVLGYQG